MLSLRNRLLLMVALIAAILLAAKTALELRRVEVPVATAGGQRLQMTLLEARPLLEDTYKVEGASGLEPMLGPLVKASGASDAAIVDQAGQVVAARPASLLRRPIQTTALGPAAALVGASEGRHVRLSAQGGALFAAAPLRLELARPDPASLGPQPASVGAAAVLVRLDLGPALAAARDAVLRGNALLGAALLLPLVLLGLGLQIGVVRPSARIRAALERFDRGEREARTEVRGSDEIASIGTAFDAMAERIQGREAELVELNARLDAVLESLPIGIMVVQREDGRPLYVSSKWKELYGIPMDASRDVLSLLSTVRCERPDGSPIPLEQLPIPMVLRTGSPSILRDMRIRRDDAVIPLVARAVPVNLWSAESFDAVVGTVQSPDLPTWDPPTDRWKPEPRGWDAAETVGLAFGSPRTAAPTEDVEPETMLAGEPVEWGPPVELEPDGPPAVLVVEGEDALRDLAERTLEAAGYRVIVARNGEEAIAFSRDAGGPIAAILLDLWVSAPGGGPLVDALRHVQPSARLIAASGYRTDMPALAARGLVAAFLAKPYGEERLLTTLRQVLERETATGQT